VLISSDSHPLPFEINDPEDKASNDEEKRNRIQEHGFHKDGFKAKGFCPHMIEAICNKDFITR